MANETTAPPVLWALLIGIARYLPGQLATGQSYPSLEGAVRDVERMERFLTKRLGVPSDRIVKLTSSGSEPAERLPSYDNIVAAWQRLGERAHPGEQVLIHYSGHGGRVPTLVPELKGARGVDECLVPFDVALPRARYLRDLELARLLGAMVEKGLAVTLVLDCCHAGGLTRGEGTVARGLGALDTTPRPSSSLVASRSELAAWWSALAGRVARSTQTSGWLPAPRGYVLLAACQAHQTAFEVALDGHGKSGALSYWLVQNLEKLDPRLTWRRLHQRLLGQIHGSFESQTPVIEGEIDRVVFGSCNLPEPPAVDVLRIDWLRGRVLIAVGEAQGVARGDRFTLYPNDADDLGGVEKRLAEIELEQLGATCSWAKVTRPLCRGGVEPGDRAVLLEPGSLRLRRAVRLPDPAVCEPEFLEAIERALNERGGGFLELAVPGAAADFQLVVENGWLEILDTGGTALPRLGPLDVDGPQTPARLLTRLIGLAKYRNVQTLENPTSFSPLRSQLEIELLRLPPGYREGDPLETRRFEDAGIATATAGEWVCLHIHNRSRMVLFLTVLDLQPDWGITQIHPSPEGFSTATLERGQHLDLPFETHLLPNMAAGTDVIKVFVTLDATDFRWLQLPALETPPPAQKTFRLQTPLEQLFATMATGLPPKRELEPAAAAALEWECAQIELRVVAAHGNLDPRRKH